MAEVEIRFERENLEGVVAVGTYLVDAAKRFGVRPEEACDLASGVHHCALEIKSGGDLLSPETKAESEFFKANGRKKGERLACQAKIERAGEVVVMTKKKVVEEPVVETPAEDKDEQYRKEFAEMPLEKKIANLVRLETIALGETVSFIINSPFTIADKVMDVMAEFGFKKEEKQKEAVRPEEHKADTAESAVETDRPGEADATESVVEAEEPNKGASA